MKDLKDLIKYINGAYAARAAKRSEPWQAGVIRASGIGYEPRRLILKYRDDLYYPSPVSPRGLRTFEVGDDRHLRLQNILKDFPGGQFPSSKEEEEELTLKIDVPFGPEEDNGTWVIRGHIDGYCDEVQFDGRTYKNVVIDFKTANSKGWRWTCNDQINAMYRAQAQMYMHMKGASWHMWIFENKDTQELHPSLMPYSEEAAKELIRKAEYVAGIVTLGHDPIIDVDACEGEDFGFETKKIPKLGLRSVARWGCSYCSYWKHCYPRGVKIRWGGRQVLFENEDGVPDGDVGILGMGDSAIPRDGWDLTGVEE